MYLLFRWFCGKTDRNRAEELLNTVQQDGAFLLRFSSTDKNVFVLSLRFASFQSLILFILLKRFCFFLLASRELLLLHCLRNTYRVDGEIWHYHLKRDGRIFVVNQTVFENLNQIVEYYSTREFVRGICLKYPIGENTVTDSTCAWFSTDRAPGCYMELKDIDKEVVGLILFNETQNFQS